LNLDEIAYLPTAITPRVPVDGEQKGHPITSGAPIEIHFDSEYECTSP